MTVRDNDAEQALGDGNGRQRKLASPRWLLLNEKSTALLNQMPVHGLPYGRAAPKDLRHHLNGQIGRQ